jgi:hypothetical protein
VWRCKLPWLYLVTSLVTGTSRVIKLGTVHDACHLFGGAIPLQLSADIPLQ